MSSGQYPPPSPGQFPPRQPWGYPPQGGPPKGPQSRKSAPLLILGIVGGLLLAYFTIQGVAHVVRDNRGRSASTNAAVGRLEAGTGASTTATTRAQADWAVGGCARAQGSSSSGDRSYAPVDCAEPAATAKVIKLLPELSLGLSEPDCPDQTDLAVSGIGLSSGTACLRNLRAPHPGDPGAGGGKASYRIVKRVAAKAECNGVSSVTLSDKDLERPVLCLGRAQPTY
jgi:hypothetical protein